MCIPVITFGAYVVIFDAEKEDESMHRHFVKSCGWTERQYKKIKDCAWFCARVSIWKDGKELAETFLGCCCYESTDEFITKYRGDYFADMVLTCADEIGESELSQAVKAWHQQFRAATAQTKGAQNAQS